MEFSVIPGRIQIERFIPVDCFRKKGSTLRSISYFQNVYQYNVCLCPSVVLADNLEHNCTTFMLKHMAQHTVLCNSNASEMREFRSLFTRTFKESSRESSSDNSRPFERNFPGTKNAISSNFRYETKFHDDKRHSTSSVPEISR